MNRVKAERALKGWSQEELAHRLEVDASSIVRWEAGGSISQDNIVGMRKLFGCSIDWLLGLCEERIPVTN